MRLRHWCYKPLRHFPCRRLANWSPLIIIFSMLMIQSIFEVRKLSGNKSSGQYSLKIFDTLSNALSSYCPRDAASSSNQDRPQIPRSVSPDDLQNLFTEERTLKSLPYPPLDDGGSWYPRKCQANYRVAIVIPFRNRHKQLPVLLHYLHPILQRQLIDYRIFVVEQYGNSTFNKALMMNIAFTIIRDRFPKYDCFIFHDVDMIPEDDRNGYHCGRFPRHLSSAVDEFNYTLPYPQIAGGVLAMTADQFLRVNGYSNMYWGWGAEDDDMYFRIKASGMLLVRPPLSIGRYTMLKHTKMARWNESIYLLIQALSRFQKDGLSHLPSLPYKIMHVQSRLLYTHILINTTRPDSSRVAAGSATFFREPAAGTAAVEHAHPAVSTVSTTESASEDFRDVTIGENLDAENVITRNGSDAIWATEEAKLEEMEEIMDEMRGD